MDKEVQILMPNNDWYVGTINYVEEDILILTSQKSDLDGHYYKVVMPISSIVAVEYKDCFEE